LYKIIFHNHGEIYEIYARNVYQSNLYGFVEAENYVYGKHTQAVIDPTEERIKKEFRNVRRSYIPMNAIIRIDEIENKADLKMRITSSDGNKSTPFFLPVMPKSDNSGE